MRTSIMLRTTTLAAALFALAGAAQADCFKSNKSGPWSDAADWVQSATCNGTYVAASRAPTTGDYVEVQNGHTVTLNANADATRLTVDAGGAVSATTTLTLHGDGSTTILTADVYGTLAISSGGSVVLTGTAPLMTVRSGGCLSFSGGSNPNFSVPNDGVVSILSGASMPVSGVASITVASGGDFDVHQGATVPVGGVSPGLVINGVLGLDGYLELTSSSGTPYISVTPSQQMPLANGEIRGLAGAASQPEFRIDATAAATQITNYGLIDGRITIKRGSGSNNATFVNHNIVLANVANVLSFHSSLASVSDDTSNAIWRVATNGSAVLQFDKGSGTFSGTFSMLVSGGTLNINDTISATSPSDPLVYNLGTINVASGKNFYFSAGGGSCASQPTSPLSNTSYGTCP